MNKTQFYLSECREAASKSPMCFKLGAVLVKGGKIISTGYNHHRTHYDGADVQRRGHRSRFKGWSGGFQEEEMTTPIYLLNHRSLKGAPPLKDATVFQGPGVSNANSKRSASLEWMARRKSMKGRPVRGRKIRSKNPKRRSSSSCGEDGSGSESSGSETPGPSGSSSSQSQSDGPQYQLETLKSWDARRRDPRVNGADLYVARITKHGCGNARPCWRCLEWCKWAGVKRIFHWNEETNQFDVVKVNNAARDKYETHADVRLFAGLGW